MKTQPEVERLRQELSAAKDEIERLKEENERLISGIRKGQHLSENLQWDDENGGGVTANEAEIIKQRKKITELESEIANLIVGKDIIKSELEKAYELFEDIRIILNDTTNGKRIREYWPTVCSRIDAFRENESSKQSTVKPEQTEELEPDPEKIRKKLELSGEERFNQPDPEVNEWLKTVSEETYTLVSDIEKEMRYNPGTKAKMILSKVIEKLKVGEVEQTKQPEEDTHRLSLKANQDYLKNYHP